MKHGILTKICPGILTKICLWCKKWFKTYCKEQKYCCKKHGAQYRYQLLKDMGENPRLSNKEYDVLSDNLKADYLEQIRAREMNNEN